MKLDSVAKTPECSPHGANATVHFLLTYILATLLPPSE